MEDPERVLIVYHDPAFAKQVGTLLRGMARTISCTMFGDAAAVFAIHNIHEFQPHLVIFQEDTVGADALINFLGDFPTPDTWDQARQDWTEPYNYRIGCVPIRLLPQEKGKIGQMVVLGQMVPQTKQALRSFIVAGDPSASRAVLEVA